MNLYFLVEGRRTEMRLYPRWLEALLPHFSRVPHPDEARKNHYFLISGEGYPRLLDAQLPHSIEDVNASGRFQYLILCLDADEVPVAERLEEVRACLENQAPPLTPSTTFRVIVQNRCIETWLLGNRRIVSRQPQEAELRRFLAFWDVSIADPEGMGVIDGFDNHADFHLHYLQAIFQARNLRYSKNSPGPAAERTYLEELIRRCGECPTHLLSLQTLLNLCRNVDSLTRPSDAVPLEPS